MDLSGSLNLIGGVLDVTNTFQNTVIASADRIYATMPPYYLQRFWVLYPMIKIKYIKRVKRVLKACNIIQGTKPSGQNWWIVLDVILTDFGLSNVPCYKSLCILVK